MLRNKGKRTIEEIRHSIERLIEAVRCNSGESVKYVLPETGKGYDPFDCCFIGTDGSGRSHIEDALVKLRDMCVYDDVESTKNGFTEYHDSICREYRKSR